MAGSDHRDIGMSGGVQGHIRVGRNTRPYGAHQSSGIPKFLFTLQADLVSPFLNREHTAQSAVMTTEGKPDKPTQDFHQSSAR